MLKNSRHRENFITHNQRRKSFLTARQRGKTGQLRRFTTQEHTTETKKRIKKETDKHQHGKDNQRQQSG